MGRPTAAQSLELEETIKSSALELFLDKGYDAVTMDQIAEAANITKRTLYLRYKDKHQLFSEALRQAQHVWKFSDASISASKNATLEAQLLKAGKALLEQALNPTIVKLSRIAATQADYFPEEMLDDYDIYMSPRIRSIVNILEQHESELKPHVIRDYPMIAELFLGIITGLPARLAGFGSFRDPKFENKRIRKAVQLFVDGIKK